MEDQPTYHWCVSCPSLSVNLLLVPQLIQTTMKVEFWPNQFSIKDVYNNFLVGVECYIVFKEKLYKLCEWLKKYLRPIAFIPHINY